MGFLRDMWRDAAAASRPASAVDGFAPPNVPERWAHDSDWLFDWPPPRNVIVGEERHQPLLRKLARCQGRCLRPVDVTLQPEPTNSYDANAIIAMVDHHPIGYLRAVVAAQIAEARAPVRAWTVPGVMRGGWDDDARIGVHVWLDRRVSIGPATAHDDDAFMVSWPPSDDELEAVR